MTSLCQLLSDNTTQEGVGGYVWIVPLHVHICTNYQGLQKKGTVPGYIQHYYVDIVSLYMYTATQEHRTECRDIGKWMGGGFLEMGLKLYKECASMS